MSILLSLLNAAAMARLPVVCPEPLDWVAVGLGAVGGVLALVASILGIRAKPPNEAFQSGSTEIGSQLRLTSWVLLPGALAVLAGVGLQIIRLLQRC